MKQHHECYGKMFPDILNLPADQPKSGKVFTVLNDQSGGMLQSKKSITPNQEQWDNCMSCPEFDHCYKFSIAKVSLATALSSV
ncbi:hypothetical protein Pla110_15380 [Polystyrenella longa]|uniref:Uncharacterized protein n=1 Tax=Polystyrenella longa TaxID=2528007 RepID=A0A518CKR6_9PLAN|nr:hypothetical protein [Polystyrenella longa]QDU79819.1 hypothetical protein Pla110_15380 [Polystyrenella longa]